VHRLEFYTPEDLQRIVSRSAKILSITMDEAGGAEIARRSRGTPRVANRLLRRVRDYAEVRAKGHITLDVARDALAMLRVDDHGLDEVDRNLLLTIIEKYQGGPVGLNTLGAVLAEEPDAIEEIYEPFLIQIGFLNRLRKMTGEELDRFTWEKELPPNIAKVRSETDPQKATETRGSKGGFRILDYISETRVVGRNYVARCPSCALAGRDRGRDNLAILVSDSRFYQCWAGCSKEMIRAALGCPIPVPQTYR